MADLFASIQPLHAALDYHLERHSVLASNVAHVDTPGYKPSDLARVDATDGTELRGRDGRGHGNARTKPT